MPYKKFSLMLVLLFLLINFVSALSISVESPILKNTPWTINANLSSMNNNDITRIYLDSEQIFVVMKVDNQFIKVSSSVKMINYVLNEDNGVLILFYDGLNEGNYLVKIESNNDSKSVEVIVFDSKTKQDELTNKVSSLESEISSLRDEINLKDAQISNLIKENSDLDSALKLLDSKMRLLEQEGKTKEEILSEIKSDLNILLVEREEAKKNPLTGMFVFGAENSGLLLGLLALIALVVVGIFVKSRNSSIYSNSLFGDDDVAPELESDNSDSPDLSSLNETRVSPFKSLFSKFNKKDSSKEKSSKKKKWAVEPYHGETKEDSKEDKRFELGDLIKREK